MGEIGVISVTAPSLQKLERSLQRRLSGYAPDRVLSVSHASEPVTASHTGGIWSPARTTVKQRYSAVVLIKTD